MPITRPLPPQPLRRAGLLACALASGAGAVPAQAPAETFQLVVQPILPPERTREAYRPLVEYLNGVLAPPTRIEQVTAVNFMGYWARMRRGQYDLVLDAAHFTDYRIEQLDYVPLAKVRYVVSYTLVSAPETLIIEPRELVGRPVATVGSPSLGALRLARLFPNPLRQPVVVEAPNSQAAAKKVLNGDAVGAMIPTPLTGRYPSLNMVMTTAQVPHMALSAAPRLPEPVRRRIRDALLHAEDTEAGQAMLEAVNLPGFEPASAARYEGYAALLDGVWGYRRSVGRQ